MEFCLKLLCCFLFVALPPLANAHNVRKHIDAFTKWEKEIGEDAPWHDPSQKSALPLASEPSLFNETAWSSYRPQLYFGLKNRRADSPVFGLMWYQQGQTQLAEKVPLRHWAMHEDEVVFMWNMHDGRSFGSQNVTDGQMEMHTDWLNFGAASWMARVSVERPSWPRAQSLVLYFALQDPNSRLAVLNDPEEERQISLLRGRSAAVGGNFTIRIRDISHSSTNNSFLALRREPFVDLARVAELVKGELRPGTDGNFGFGVMQQTEPNLGAVQITAKEDCAVEVVFLADHDAPPPPFERTLSERKDAFEAKFRRAFPIARSAPALHHRMGHSALSNLLGGIGVWHEKCLMRSKLFSPPFSTQPFGPLSLISGVPSRTTFPHGFIWDEGFHNLLIHRIDPALTLQIIGAYLDMMNVDGWIPREIAIGSEAMARIPQGYVVQEDWVANPPMFFYLLREMANKPEIVTQFGPELRRLYPRMKQLYIWFRTRQSGVKPNTFRWRGRNQTTHLELNPQTLASGFDDYPRASHPTEEEYHLDLRCWMAMSATVLAQLAQMAGDVDFVPVIREESVLLNDLDELDRLHWSEKTQRYCDYGLHSESVKLVPDKTPEGETILVRKVLKEPQPGLVKDVNGYANLFPLLLQMLPPDSPRLGSLLKQIGDPEEFWTPYGLRSVSVLSPYYNTWNSNDTNAKPYWRGPIWMNMNYFAASALKHYSAVAGPHRELCAQLYAELRRNLVANVADQYAKTGFLWEHYNDQTGAGEGSHPFTGWTTLILKVMTESY